MNWPAAHCSGGNKTPLCERSININATLNENISLIDIDGAVGFVGFFVDGKIGESFGAIDAVELFEAVDFCCRDFGHLGFVGVERGDGFGYGAITANFAKHRNHGLGAGQSGAAADVFFGDADGGGEITPELRVRAVRIFFFGKILHHGGAQRAFGSRGENSQMFGKGFDVAVILRGVQLKRFAAELAGLPILIERMVQEILLGNRRIEAVHQMGLRHG